MFSACYTKFLLLLLLNVSISNFKKYALVLGWSLLEIRGKLRTPFSGISMLLLSLEIKFQDFTGSCVDD